MAENNFLQQAQLRRFWRHHWPQVLFAFCFIGVAIAGAVVLSSQSVWQGSKPDKLFPDLAFHVVRLFGGDLPDNIKEDPVPRQVQWVSLAATAVTVVTLLQVLAAMLSRVNETLTLMRRARKHVVICGLSRKAWHLAGTLRVKQFVVIIERDSAHPSIEDARDLGIAVLVGDAKDPQILRRAHARRAEKIVCLCDDATNMDIRHAVRTLNESAGESGVRCHVHIGAIHLHRPLQFYEFRYRNPNEDDLRFFNISEEGAERLLRSADPLAPWRSLDSPAVSPHFVIIGAGAMGQALARGLARQWSVLGDPGMPLRLCLVERKASEQRERMLLEHPALRSCWELRAFDTEIPGISFSRGAWLDKEDLPHQVFVCLSGDGDALVAGLEVLRHIIALGGPGSPPLRIPIHVRIAENGGLLWSDILQQNRGDYEKLLKPFRVLEQTMTSDFDRSTPQDVIARTVHEAYLAVLRAEESAARAAGRTYDRPPAMVPWENLGPEDRESCRGQAMNIQKSIESLNPPLEVVPDSAAGPHAVKSFTDSQLDTLGRIEHDRWMQEKIDRGWRHSPETDREKKLHKDIVDWKDLPLEARKKDFAMAAAWPAALHKAGLAIRPKQNA